jgi:3'(2'), 5'-bisphosphate nucleotidase
MAEHLPLEHWLTRTCEIARAAGAAILQVATGDTAAEAKADGSPLTRADLASHDVIMAGLSGLTPRLPILSEEGDLTAFGPDAWSAFWCVDPLDGTKEFVKGLGEYTVNIALVERTVPVLGVIYVPAQDVLYYAARGLRAWRSRGAAAALPIAASRCRTARSAVVSRSHLSPETEAFLQGLGVTRSVQHGSSIKICAVAEGTADIYPRHGPTCLWDTAAGTAIALEAGCRVIGLDGSPLSYDPALGLKRPGFIVLPQTLDAVVRP